MHGADLESMTLRISGSSHREPSSEAMLHYAIYAQRPDVQAILHGHCVQITAKADILGLPVTRQAVESGTLLIVEQVMEVIDDHPFLEIRDHGFLSMSESIETAGLRALEMIQRAMDQKHKKPESY
ncbi:MAG: class II aldolase/adducin family protein [bacterium]